MKNIILLITLSSLLLTTACTSSEDIAKSKSALKVHLGVSQGGIIENTDLSLLLPDGIDANTGATVVDAYTGATRTGLAAGVHYEYPLKWVILEGGVDGFLNSQTFTYDDDFSAYFGTRDLLVSQFRFPLSVNARLIRKKFSNGLIQIKLGVTPGLCFYSVNDEGSSLPAYEKSVFSMGPLLGAELTPFKFSNGSELGISFEFSRSFQAVYTDYYQVGDMPGMAYWKAGLLYRFYR